MVHSVYSNLDRSIGVVPKGQAANYLLHSNGTVTLCTGSVLGWFYRAIQYISDYLYNQSLRVITTIFTHSVEQLIALINEERHQIRAVSLEEFSTQAKRIGFAAQFILAHKEEFEKCDELRNCIKDALGELIPGKEISFPNTISQITEDVMEHIDVVLAWRLQELSPPPLTDRLFKAQANRKEILDLPHAKERVTDLPTLYDAVVNELENPEGSLWYSFVNILPWTYHATSRRILRKMCQTVQKKRDLHPYSEAEFYLTHFMSECRKPTVPLQKKKTGLDEIVEASKWCFPRVATTSESQFRKLREIDVTLHDKLLIWKEEFIEQTLLGDFLKKRLDPTEYSHNTHYLNAIYHEWGDRLGVVGLTVPTQDTYRIRKLSFTWDDVHNHLLQAWNAHFTESVGVQINKDSCAEDVKLFLIQTVKEKLPSVKDAQAFVMQEYFDEMLLLNKRGANRLLRATLASAAPGL